jgi:hypothetical protein
MARITTYFSILTLNVNDLTPIWKDTNWQTGLKRETLQSVVYKKSNLQRETNIALGWKGKRKLTKLMVP